MSVTTIHSTTATHAPVASTATQAPTGLSSVASSISSAESGDAQFLHPIAQFFDTLLRRLVTFLNSLLPETDMTRIRFFLINWDRLEGDVKENGLALFSRFSESSDRFQAFKLILITPSNSAETIRAFYDLLPIEDRNGIEHQIWVANEQNDNGEGLDFGRNVINADIKGNLVRAGVTLHMLQSFGVQSFFDRA